jgi:hypothetical protein
MLLDNSLRAFWFDQGGFPVSNALHANARWGTALRASVRQQDVLF